MKIISNKVRFAVVGCGHIGKRHAEMITRNKEAELIALCDIRPKEELGIDDYNVPFFANIEDMISEMKGKIDVVNICTPNGIHAEQSLLALDERMHVVCEKPLALSKAEAEKVIFKSLQVSRAVFTVMQNRYSPPSQWIKSIIEQGIMGQIYMVQLNCYWNRDKRYYKPGSWKGTANLDGGTLFTQFSHFIDIMYWLFGDIENINASFRNFNHDDVIDFEDSGIVSFRFINGGMGSLNYSTSVWDKNFESSIIIIAEKGSVKLGGQYMNKVEYCHIENYTMPKLGPVSAANDYGEYKGSAANHHFVIENVVDTLKGKTSITANALEGLKVVEIIERIYSCKKQSLLNNK